ncbi:MAG: hypothetical protein LRY76_07005 [Alphaproteobacteria bacterium]|nr:hypothetical protein [Alphaproteobacteria bacterium]MCD8526346.1 hypothetical protein [Alphaproteobacteria bacterium]MCD8571253.1 hypothetical protein [Alphaproteobacteria bacterium]
MRKLHKTVNVAIFLSEISHIFCCVLPTLFSVLTLLAGLGVLAAVPVLMVHVHDFIHHYELWVIGISGALIALGWGLHRYSLKMDCHDTGCHHPPCTPVKRKTSKFLIVATILFAVNVLVYGVVHQGLGVSASQTHDEAIHGSDEP